MEYYNVNGHLTYFYILATMNIASLNICVQFLCVHMFPLGIL